MSVEADKGTRAGAAGAEFTHQTLPLVRRLAGDFLRPYVGRIALALLCMGLAAGSTAANAWLMEPVLDRIFIAARLRRCCC